MASPDAAERGGLPGGGFRCGLRDGLRYVLAAAALAAASLLLLQLSLGRRLAEQRQRQLGAELAAQVLLGEVALERFTPATLERISGLRLAVGSTPEPEPAARSDPEARPERGQGSVQGSGPGSGAAAGLPAPARRLQRDLCARLGRCPAVVAGGPGTPGVWVALESPLEPVWLFAPLPPLPGWPPDPLLLALALGSGGLGGGLLFLALEVQRPLRRLERALAAVGGEAGAAMPLEPQGSPAVRSLTLRFNTMLERLARTARERSTMLAGIAHDLRAPLTRLRLRLDQAAARAALPPEERRRGSADLEALERITAQFLLFAGAESAEPPLLVPLADLVAEGAALVDGWPLELDLQPLQRRVRPTALARALANLLENALSHGAPPLRLVLRATESAAQPAVASAAASVVEPASEGGFVLEVWDSGAGIAAADWQAALEPFQRLDPARGGRGHCGLGLAIAERIARDHGGGLRRLERPGAFGVALEGRSLPPASVTFSQRSGGAGHSWEG